MNSIGFGPNPPVNPLRTRSRSGARQRMKSGILVHLDLSSVVKISFSSVVLAQVHAGVELCNLISVAIEHQRRAAEKLSQPALLGLAPAGVIYVGVHVRVEAVFMRVGHIPGGGRLSPYQLDLHN